MRDDAPTATDDKMIRRSDPFAASEIGKSVYPLCECLSVKACTHNSENLSKKLLPVIVSEGRKTLRS